jgi:central glycolytic genes regulator
MQLDDLESIPHIIAVAGGSSKAGAIEAYFKKPRRTVLVTDEGAAKELLRESIDPSI